MCLFKIYGHRDTPDFYSHMICEVTNANGGTTCTDCDTNPNSGFGGSLANQGITWDD